MDDRERGFTEYFASRSGAMRGTAYLLCGDWHRAAYRYPDGTVVLLAQSADVDGSGRPAIAGLPLSENQLLAMVTDPRFHLD